MTPREARRLRARPRIRNETSCNEFPASTMQAVQDESNNPSNRALSREEIATRLKDLPEWLFENNMISRVFTFSSYSEVVAFAVKVAMLAERTNHHPELELKYGSLNVCYSTHDVGGISEADFTAARAVERL